MRRVAAVGELGSLGVSRTHGIELRLLIASIVLGLVDLIASSHLISWQRGYRWTASSRADQLKPKVALSDIIRSAQ
jgi:hypothetical protein